MKKFEYIKPEDFFEGKNKPHQLELHDNGELVGFAHFDYRNYPFPFYRVDLIFIKPDFRGSGYGREFMKEINSFLIKKGKAGLLLNSIDEDDPTHNMYEKYGWKPVEGREPWFSFNLPDGVDKEKLSRAINRTEVVDEKKKSEDGEFENDGDEEDEEEYFEEEEVKGCN